MIFYFCKTHGENIVLNCPDNETGNINVLCADAVVSIVVNCYPDCVEQEANLGGLITTVGPLAHLEV